MTRAAIRLRRATAQVVIDAYCQTIATNLEEIAPPARRAAAPGGVTVAG